MCEPHPSRPWVIYLFVSVAVSLPGCRQGELYATLVEAFARRVSGERDCRTARGGDRVARLGPTPPREDVKRAGPDAD